MDKERRQQIPTGEALEVNAVPEGPELIIQTRNILGWSQEQLACESGLSQGYLCQIETGEVTNPLPDQLLQSQKP